MLTKKETIMSFFLIIVIPDKESDTVYKANISLTKN
jgi:hypothetical protein